MLVFVDESGDPGMKLNQGSTPCFAVCAVIFKDRTAALACNQAINDLRGQLGFRDAQEFKFSKCSRAIRLRFLRAVAPHSFRYHAVVINKCNLHGPGFQYKDSHYKYSIRLVFENARPMLSGATVFFDTCGGREFVRQLREYLRKRMTDKDGNCPIKKVTSEQSHSNNLIQLADMVCGAVARSFKLEKADCREYREAIRYKEERVQFWPP